MKWWLWGPAVLLRMAFLQGSWRPHPSVALRCLPHPLGMCWMKLLQVGWVLPCAPATQCAMLAIERLYALLDSLGMAARLFIIWCLCEQYGSRA